MSTKAVPDHICTKTGFFRDISVENAKPQTVTVSITETVHGTRRQVTALHICQFLLFSKFTSLLVL